MSYLLDTSAWIALLRGRQIGVLDRLKQHLPEEILLCSIVLAELWFGAERSDASRRAGNHALVDELQAKYVSLPFDDLSAREYATIRADLTAKGSLIGPNDTMIAAIARSRGVTLVSHNTAEFSRVPDLSIEDWQAS